MFYFIFITCLGLPVDQAASPAFFSYTEKYFFSLNDFTVLGQMKTIKTVTTYVTTRYPCSPLPKHVNSYILCNKTSAIISKVQLFLERKGNNSIIHFLTN